MTKHQMEKMPSMKRYHFGQCDNDIYDAIKSLSARREKIDFHSLKNIVLAARPEYLGYLLVAAARKGIIRDVQFITPIVITNNCLIQINEALCEASANAHTSIIEYLLNNGADIHYDGENPLRRAVREGYVESVDVLLEKGANVHVSNDSLLLDCCRSGDYPDVLKSLFSHGINVLTHYHNALNLCYEKNHSDSARVLICWSANRIVEKKLPTSDNEDFDQVLQMKELEEYNARYASDSSDYTNSESSESSTDEGFSKPSTPN